MEISPFLSPAFREFFWLVCFPSRRLPCSSESPRDFFSPSLSPDASRRAESFSGNHRVPGKRSPCEAASPAPVSPMGQLCHAFGVLGEVGGTRLPCPVVGVVRQSKVQLASLLCCRAKKLSPRKKHQKVPLTKLNPFPTSTAATGHDGNLSFVRMGNWARCNEKFHCSPFLCCPR